MEDIAKLVAVCESYKLGEFDIKEFQERLETIFLPEQYRSIEEEQHNAFNRLEEIQFCYQTNNQRKHALKVADDLITVVKVYNKSK